MASRNVTCLSRHLPAGFNVTQLFVLLVLLAAKCSAFPSGPPVSSYPAICESLAPFGHGHDPEDDPSPYRIHVEGNCYKGDMEIKGLIYIPDDDDDYYEGVMMEARQLHDDSDCYGTFVVGTDTQMQTLDCFGGTSNALGHNSAARKRCNVFLWVAPPSISHNIQLNATIVHEVDHYHMGVVSRTLQYRPDCPDQGAVSCTNLPTLPPTTTTPDPDNDAAPGALYPSLVLMLSMVIVSKDFM